jgi:integrase
MSDRQEAAVARHSPQKVGIETRRDRNGRERHRGVVYDGRTKQAIRGPWSASLAAARAWRTDALDRLAKGTLSGDRRPTVRKAMTTFLRGIEDGSIHNRSRRRYKPSVVRDYKRDLGRRIDPLLGPRYLREIQLPDVQLVADTLSGRGLSASSVRNSIMALRALYAWARPRGLAFQQPCDGVRLPGGEERRMRVVSPDEAALLVGAVTGHDRTAFALACYAGLRAGELLALDWDDVDLERRIIRVERAWDHGSREFIAPKSKAAYRIIPITERLWAVLSEHRETLGSSGLLLPARRGDRSRPMGHSALVKRLKKRWRTVGLESLKLHEGRHTFASLLIAAGANAKAITTYMGHSSIQVTYDRYGHLMPGSEAEVAGLLDAYLASSASPLASPQITKDCDFQR